MLQSISGDPVLEPGRVIGGCRVVREIKRGGMGCVYLAEHLTLGCPVALKTILPFQDDERGRRLFFREARVCAQIDHPNVVVIHNAGEEDGVPYIIMRHVDGKNLAEYLNDQGGPLPWAKALSIMRSVARGLSAVHRRKLVHRDVKPSNIMVSFEGRVLLMDFGLVRDASEGSLSATTGVMGTPQYMSPEQCAGVSLDGRSDIFSLGSSLYYLLTRVPPFGLGDTAAVLHRILARQAPRPVHMVNPAVPQAVSDLVARCMAFDPQHRFQTVDELDRAIRELLQQSARQPDVAVCLPSPEGDPDVPSGSLSASLAPLELIPLDLSEPPFWKRRAGWIALAAVACVAVLGLIVVSADPPAEPPKPPNPQVDLAGMVLIDAGRAQLGISLEKTKAAINASGDTASGVGEPANSADVYRERFEMVGRFWIDKYEVTNRQYQRFLEQTRYPRKPSTWQFGNVKPEELDDPVTGVTHADAMAFAKWRGMQLPTRAEWMRAYHGDTSAPFPWGDEYQSGWANVKENRQGFSHREADAKSLLDEAFRRGMGGAAAC
jgi:serine/threonine-protein kinase